MAKQRAKPWNEALQLPCIHHEQNGRHYQAHREDEERIRDMPARWGLVKVFVGEINIGNAECSQFPV